MHVYEVKPHHNTIHILILLDIIAFQSIRNIIHFFPFLHLLLYISFFYWFSNGFFAEENFYFTWKYFYERYAVSLYRDSQSNEQTSTWMEEEKKPIIIQTSNFQCFLQFFCVLKGKLKNSFIYVRSNHLLFM